LNAECRGSFLPQLVIVDRPGRIHEMGAVCCYELVSQRIIYLALRLAFEHVRLDLSERKKHGSLQERLAKSK
jgi:hypothetical protein